MESEETLAKFIELERTDGQKCTLQIFDKHGQPMLIARQYLKRLAQQGWHGLDKIPPECITNLERINPQP